MLRQSVCLPPRRLELALQLLLLRSAVALCCIELSLESTQSIVLAQLELELPLTGSGTSTVMPQRGFQSGQRGRPLPRGDVDLVPKLGFPGSTAVLCRLELGLWWSNS